MKLTNRSWGTWGLVLLLVGSLMAPTVSNALPRGGDNLLGGYEDQDPPDMGVVGDPNDGSGNRPQPATLDGVAHWRLVLEGWLRLNLNRASLIRLGLVTAARHEMAKEARR